MGLPDSHFPLVLPNLNINSGLKIPPTACQKSVAVTTDAFLYLGTEVVADGNVNIRLNSQINHYKGS